MTVTSGQRACPHCGAPNPLDLVKKCTKCRKRLPVYCFSCYAALPKDDAQSCPSCGRRRWIMGDFAQVACVAEKGTVRQQRYMKTFMTKDGKVVHEWRCMTCLQDDTRTDALVHLP